MEKLKVAVVGGGTGGRLSMKAAAASDLFELVSVADRRPEVGGELKAAYPSISFFTDYREMFAKEPIDVVCVSTYAPSHEEITRAALSLPLKGILVEKPLGHTVASGRKILGCVKQKGIPMAVPHGLLAQPHSIEIARRVRSGEIGDLELVEIQSAKWDIINAGIHWLNYFATLTGNEPMANVMALCDSTSRTFRDGMQVETRAVTYAQTRSGVRVVMHTGDDIRVSREGKDTLFRIIGTTGIIEFWGWERAYVLQNAANPGGRSFTMAPAAVAGHQFHLEHIAAMMGKAPDYRIPESSLLALEICEGAYLSSRHHCQVDFPVDSFAIPKISDWDPGMPYSGTGGGRDGRAL